MVPLDRRGREDDEAHQWTTEHITCGVDGFPSNDELLNYEKAAEAEKAALEIPDFDLYRLPEFKEDFDGTDDKHTKGHIYKVRVTLHPSSADDEEMELHMASDQAITDAITNGNPAEFNEKFSTRSGVFSNGIAIRSRDDLANIRARINTYVQSFQLRANADKNEAAATAENGLPGRVEIAIQSSSNDENIAFPDNANSSDREAMLQINAEELGKEGHMGLKLYNGESHTVTVAIRQNNGGGSGSNIVISDDDLQNVTSKDTTHTIRDFDSVRADTEKVDIEYGRFHEITLVHVQIKDKDGDGLPFRQASGEVVLENNNGHAHFTTAPDQIPTDYRRLYSRRDIRERDDYWSDPDLLDSLLIQAGTIDTGDHGAPKVITNFAPNASGDRVGNSVSYTML